MPARKLVFSGSGLLCASSSCTPIPLAVVLPGVNWMVPGWLESAITSSSTLTLAPLLQDSPIEKGTLLVVEPTPVNLLRLFRPNETPIVGVFRLQDFATMLM